MKLESPIQEFTRRNPHARKYHGRIEFGDFSGKNAYEVLRISKNSSSNEIKASFRKLAMETHPDVCSSSCKATASIQFLQILAAYEILSDPEIKAHYDIYLSSLKMLHKKSDHYSFMHTNTSTISTSQPGEVVEWLKWYKDAINDIVMENKVANGSDYFDKLELELHSAIYFAFHGPFIESMDVIPNSFEAEERSSSQTSELLHLVSGRHLFGIIYTVDKLLELPQFGLFESLKIGDFDSTADMYKTLELHIYGKLVATASRRPSHCLSKGACFSDNEDRINIFLNLNENGYNIDDSGPVGGPKIPLGTISGLRSDAEEGICSVFDRNGEKTHVIVKHRTLLVKHMHWFQFCEGEISAYECRCTRARLPPSKYWLFEPRSSMHDVGGWYIETYGQNKGGRTVLSKRHWDGVNDISEKRLHPAMYLLALAYRTLDIEAEKRKKITVRAFLEPKVRNFLRWCKRIL